jgi:hypothetical protein
MTTAIDPLQQAHVEALEAEVRQLLLEIDDLYATFATLQRNFLFCIDQLKAKRDIMLRKLYQLTGDATPPSSDEQPAAEQGPAP